MIRENMVAKIAQLKEQLAEGGKSTYTQDSLERTLRQEQKNLEALDAHGDIGMIQQMVFEHNVNQD